KPKHTHTSTVLWACSPQRNMAPQTKTQAHPYVNRAVGLQPAAAHGPANENPSTTPGILCPLATLLSTWQG
ncbi:MAG: hypothetical protein ACOX9E_06115, partial [Lentisphaeria bacterium]